MAEKENIAPESKTISDEDMAYLTKSLWESLQTPVWKKDDLIDFGTAIFSKKNLRAMDDKVFDKIFPFLRQISETLAAKLSSRANQTPADEKKETPAPAAQEEAK